MTEPLLLAATQVSTFDGARALTKASGFFFSRDRRLFLATSRHVSCGGPDLEAVAWDTNTLSGESDLVAGDPYVLYLTEPAGYRFDLRRRERVATPSLHALPGGEAASS